MKKSGRKKVPVLTWIIEVECTTCETQAHVPVHFKHKGKLACEPDANIAFQGDGTSATNTIFVKLIQNIRMQFLPPQTVLPWRVGRTKTSLINLVIALCQLKAKLYLHHILMMRIG